LPQEGARRIVEEAGVRWRRVTRTPDNITVQIVVFDTFDRHYK
jgi:hypothetical protein